MSDPFRDEATAATELASELEAENEELRGRLARLDGSSASLQRQIEDAENAALVERMRVKELEEKVGDRPPTPAWVVRLALLLFVVGAVMGNCVGR